MTKADLVFKFLKSIAKFNNTLNCNWLRNFTPHSWPISGNNKGNVVVVLFPPLLFFGVTVQISSHCWCYKTTTTI